MKITKKTATSLVALTLVSGIGLAGVNTIASAQGNPKHQDTLVEKIANKFNLNKSDVQKVFDDNRSENENRREAKEKSRLDQAVKDGKITKDQEDKIIAKLRELREQKKDEKTQKRDKRQELKQWAKDNNIPLELLHAGKRHQGQ